MMKARNDGIDNVKVVGRFLVVNGEKFDCRSIPDSLVTLALKIKKCLEGLCTLKTYLIRRATQKKYCLRGFI